MDKIKIIKCPVCGYQYLPGEIFYPNSFVGQPSWVNRNDNGEIIDYDPDGEMDLEENFTCTNCLTPFKVIGSVGEFNTYEDKINNFNEDYKTKIVKEDPIILEEN